MSCRQRRSRRRPNAPRRDELLVVPQLPELAYAVGIEVIVLVEDFDQFGCGPGILIMLIDRSGQLVSRAQEHAKQVHQMDLSREQALAMAKPV